MLPAALRRIVLPLALLLGLAACATPQLDAIEHDRGGLPARADVAGVPFYPQQAFYCGPASLAMALTWSGVPIGQAALAPAVFTPGKTGSLRTDMVAAARRHGRLAVPVTDLRGLLAELAAGRPVIVFQNLAFDWYPQWHFAVAVAYDLDAADGRGQLVLHSGTMERHLVALNTFERTWRRGGYWGLLVLPPGEMPVDADSATLIEAAIGLERAGQYRAAADAYAAIRQRWPSSAEAALGHGNALYSLGDFAPAAAAFRSATVRKPDDPIPWNNLAMALDKLDRREDALTAIHRAIQLAGANAEPYRRTLREITERQL